MIAIRSLRAPVIVIDEVLAQNAFGTQDPVGNRLWIPEMGYGSNVFEIVGVVGHVRHWGLAGDDQAKIRAQIYYPFSQLPDGLVHRWSQLMSIAVRTEIPPLGEVASLRNELKGATGDQVLYRVRTMEQLVERFAGAAALSLIVVWHIRRIGVGAGVHRDLRSAGVFDGTARARNRDTNGAGSQAEQCNLAGAAAEPRNDCHWRCDWHGGGAGRGACFATTRRGNAADRDFDVCHDNSRARTCRDVCKLSAGAACQPRGPGHRSAARLIQSKTLRTQSPAGLSAPFLAGDKIVPACGTIGEQLPETKANSLREQEVANILRGVAKE